MEALLRTKLCLMCLLTLSSLIGLQGRSMAASEGETSAPLTLARYSPVLLSASAAQQATQPMFKAFVTWKEAQVEAADGARFTVVIENVTSETVATYIDPAIHMLIYDPTGKDLTPPYSVGSFHPAPGEAGKDAREMYARGLHRPWDLVKVSKGGQEIAAQGARITTSLKPGEQVSLHYKIRRLASDYKKGGGKLDLEHLKRKKSLEAGGYGAAIGVSVSHFAAGPNSHLFSGNLKLEIGQSP